MKSNCSDGKLFADNQDMGHQLSDDPVSNTKNELGEKIERNIKSSDDKEKPAADEVEIGAESGIKKEKVVYKVHYYGVWTALYLFHSSF